MIKTILLIAMILNTPPSRFLDAKDLNQRYATQIRKLSNAPVLTDGDTFFRGVDTFRPPQELEPGVCADAVNKRFEDGRAWPRQGIAQQAWGDCLAARQRVLNVLGAQVWPAASSHQDTLVVNGVVKERVYSYTLTLFGNAPFVAGAKYECVSLGKYASALEFTGGYNVTAPGAFTVPGASGVCVIQATATVYGAFPDPIVGQPVDVIVFTASTAALALPAVQGYARFNDPQGFDTQVVITDDWRTGPGEDGGRGRVWRIQSGNQPLLVSLNGQDVWGVTRAVPCFNGLVLLRQGNERHYFAGGNVNNDGTLTLNGAANFVTGDLVQFNQTQNSYFTAGGGGSVPNPTSRYYVSMVSSTKLKLYSDAALTQQIVWNGAVGQFWIERQASFPGFYGNGAPPLLAQPSLLGNTLWDGGFKLVPSSVFITNVSGAGSTPADVITAANHGLLPGDAVTCAGVNAANGQALQSPVYACPTSANTFTVYAQAVQALAGGATGRIDLAANGSPAGATVVKAGASGLPMPSGREGAYLENRLVIINGSCTLAVSDPLDPLHFTQFTAAITANLGESDVVTALVPLPALDALLILKQNEVLILNNFSQGSGGWTLSVVTREYGCIAPLSAVQVGYDVWFLSRKGVASITQTELGIARGVADPVSKPMKKYIDQIDWRFASQACAGYWNNRFYLAVPLKGQAVAPGGAAANNGVLVFNFLNRPEGASVAGEDQEAGRLPGMWEGLWQGAALSASGMARHLVYGEERLCFVNPAAQVCWLTDGFVDPPAQLGGGAVAVADRLTTRVYTCGQMSRKLHLAADCLWDSYAPTVTVTAVTPGVNETEGLLPNPVTYDSTKYAVAGQADYVPGPATWGLPFREDYKMSDAELMYGAPDTHQNHTEPFRMRLDDWGVQLVIANASGSLRVQGVSVRAVAGPNVDNAQV